MPQSNTDGLLIYSASLILSWLLVAENAQASQPAEASSGSAGQFGRITVINENDYYASNDDRHYTQGARLSYLSGQIATESFWNKPFDTLSGLAPWFSGDVRKRKYGLRVGQNMYTPNDTQRTNLQARNRPYAAWLYGGVNLLQESAEANYHTLENFEIQAGVIGRWALGGVTQNDFHQFIGVKPALGWKNELKNEPGVILTYERKWRFHAPLYGNFGIDVIPELGVSAGNILTYGQGSALIRLGQNIAADYGPARIRPNLSGTDWFDAEQMEGSFGWYVFVGTQGRAVARNIFLDGNSFVDSNHVNKRFFVADFVTGASLFWADQIRLDFSLTQRTSEFYGQKGHPDRFGGINLSFKFW